MQSSSGTDDTRCIIYKFVEDPANLTHRHSVELRGDTILTLSMTG